MLRLRFKLLIEYVDTKVVHIQLAAVFWNNATVLL